MTTPAPRTADTMAADIHAHATFARGPVVAVVPPSAAATAGATTAEVLAELRANVQCLSCNAHICELAQAAGWLGRLARRAARVDGKSARAAIAGIPEAKRQVADQRQRAIAHMAEHTAVATGHPPTDSCGSGGSPAGRPAPGMAHLSPSSPAAGPSKRPRLGVCQVTVYAPTPYPERVYRWRPCGGDVVAGGLCAHHAEDRERLRAASP